jgi:hypothetical protein
VPYAISRTAATACSRSSAEGTWRHFSESEKGVPAKFGSMYLYASFFRGTSGYMSPGRLAGTMSISATTGHYEVNQADCALRTSRKARPPEASIGLHDHVFYSRG